VLQWRSVFFLSAGIYTAGNLIFVLFGTSEVQKWNDPIESKRNNTIPKISMEPMTIATIEEEHKDAERMP